jgi:hypoxanthine phosphoribosyltransferase
VTGGSEEATGTPQQAGEPDDDAPVTPVIPEVAEATEAAAGPASVVGGTRFAHASEAEMARILDFYAVRWEYEPTTFPILWNLDGAVVESFAPDFYLPELEMFLEMTTLKQRLVRKKNRKLRRLRELYPDIRIKLFYARDFRAMMLKYGRLALAEALSGTPGQVVPDRAPATLPSVAPELPPTSSAEPGAADAPVAPTIDRPIGDAPFAEPQPDSPARRSRARGNSRRRRRHAAAIAVAIDAGAEREVGG